MWRSFIRFFESQFKSCFEKKVSNVFVVTDNRTSRKVLLKLLQKKIIKESRVNILNSVDYKWKLTPKQSRDRSYKAEKFGRETRATVKSYFPWPHVISQEYGLLTNLLFKQSFRLKSWKASPCLSSAYRVSSFKIIILRLLPR